MTLAMTQCTFVPLLGTDKWWIQIFTVSLIYISVNLLPGWHTDWPLMETCWPQVTFNPWIHQYFRMHWDQRSWKKNTLCLINRRYVVNFNLLNFLNGMVHLPFLELYIISFRDIKIKIWSCSVNSIEPGQTSQM